MITNRKNRGSFIYDTPAALWVLFVLVMLPLIDLCSVGMKYTFMLGASRDAAVSASRAKTFWTDLSATELSARNAATRTAQNNASKWTGITLNQTDTRIVQVNLATNQVTKYSTVLPAPADSNNYLYSYETTVRGQIQPLITFRGPLWGNIPGMTAPITVSITSQKICENTQGLNQ